MILADKFTCDIPAEGTTFLECSLPQDGIMDWVTAIGTLASAAIAAIVAVYSIQQQKKSAAKAAMAASELAFNKAATRVAEAFEAAADNGQDVTRQTMYRVTNAIQALELIDYSKEYSGDKLIFVLHQADVEIIQRLYAWSTLRKMGQNDAIRWESASGHRERILHELALEVRSVLDNLQIADGEKVKLSLVAGLYQHVEGQARSLATTDPSEETIK